MKSETDIKPTLLTPDVVASMWSVSVKVVYELVNTGKLPYVLLPTEGKRKGLRIPTEAKRKRLIRIRASVAESWVLEHEVNGDETQKNSLPIPRRRRRSILKPPKGVTALNSFENKGDSQNETTENL